MSNVEVICDKISKDYTEEEGAAENIITETFESMPYPFAGDVESCGLCMTLLCDKNN